jgi:hypothetical protein
MAMIAAGKFSRSARYIPRIPLLNPNKVMILGMSVTTDRMVGLLLIV